MKAPTTHDPALLRASLETEKAIAEYRKALAALGDEPGISDLARLEEEHPLAVMALKQMNRKVATLVTDAIPPPDSPTGTIYDEDDAPLKDPLAPYQSA